MSTITIVKRSSGFLLLAGALLLAACSPKYNWREVRGKDAPFVVLLPDKPVTVTRAINLDGASVPMTMTAAEVDGVNFAVGYAVLDDAKRAPAVLGAMQTALVRNIKGIIKAPPAPDPHGLPASGGAINIEALGRRADSGEALLLLGHFEAKDNRVYQVIVLGSEKNLSREEANTFLSSFRLN